MHVRSTLVDPTLLMISRIILFIILVFLYNCHYSYHICVIENLQGKKEEKRKKKHYVVS